MQALLLNNGQFLRPIGCLSLVRRLFQMTGSSLKGLAIISSSVCFLIAAWLFVPARLVAGQEAPVSRDEVPLIDSPPFDVIVLKEAAGGQRVKIAPIANRNLAQRPSDSTKLEVVLLSHPDRRYEISWSDIERVELYERMVYDEAMRKLREKDFISAFMNLSFLMRNYPDTPNLEKLRRDFLFQSAAVMFAESKSDFNRYFQTLSTLEELRTTAPEYEERSVLNGLSRVADSLLRHYQSKGDLSSAKKLLERLDAQYGEALPSVMTWKAEFQQMAETRRQEAKELLDLGKFREARQAALDMSNISSTVEGGAELLAEIRRRHPMVRVGVMQRAGELDPASIVSWSARRAGMLVYQPVVEFMETGSEGGRYEFALGRMRLSEDHQQLILTIDPKQTSDLDGFTLTQILSSRATPGSRDYDASWAAVVQSLATPSPTQILVQLQRPHVLPHALLQFSLPDTSQAPSPLPGSYRLDAVEDNETSFVLRNPSTSSDQLVEIVEVFYDDPKQAANDLLRGEIDAIDQLFPGDARRYAQSGQMKIGTYALPSVHMLLPVSDHPYLAKEKFRRALMYATDRSEILHGELLGSDDPRDGQVISGPFPIGINKNDPLSYAYDESIQPMPYDPQLAKLLLYMVDNEISAQSIKFKVPTPERKPLRIGVPNFELARVAAQALIQQWSLAGIKAELVLLPEGRGLGSGVECDLVYLTATMSEPAIDIERLLGGNGPGSSDNAFIVQALTRLRQARSWREVRTALQDLHRLVDYHLPLMPLWQVTDRFAHSPKLHGLKSGSVAFYQDVNNWRFAAANLPVITRQAAP